MMLRTGRIIVALISLAVAGAGCTDPDPASDASDGQTDVSNDVADPTGDAVQDVELADDSDVTDLGADTADTSDVADDDGEAPPTPCTSSVECDEALSPLPACVRAQCGADGICTTTPRPDLTPCDDGNDCTTGDKCAAGLCEGGFNTCACTDDAGCSHLDDGNKCNGLWTCSTGTCAFDPTTVVDCGSGDSCSTGSCNPATGACSTVPATDGTACDDASVCTTFDTCQGGTCTGAAPLDCGQAPQCQTNTCDPVTGCGLANVDGGGCDDGDACTAADLCTGGVCTGEAITCLASGPCLSATCDPAVGCSEAPLTDGTTCDDDNPCTDNDACSGGTCDGAPGCSCTTVNDCPEVPDKCLVFACTGGFCEPEPPVVCNQNPNPCVRAECKPATGQCGLVELSNGALCDAGPCLVGGKCIDAVCEAAPKDCSDGNDCTVDSCDDDQGCLSTPEVGLACEDGDPCTSGDACDDAAQCASGDPNTCNDGDMCTADSCIAGVGCQNVDASDCDDGDLCTTDLCSPTAGCVHNPKICFGQAVGCSIPQCSPATGDCDTAPAPQGFTCDDDDACTQNESCTSGNCVGEAVNCDDGNACTADSCDSAAGCQHAPIPNCP